MRQADIWITKPRKSGGQRHDKLLRKFQYSAALDAALLRSSPDTVSALIRELVHRDALVVALANRDDIALEPVAAFVRRYIANPRYTLLLIDVANVLIGMYGAFANLLTPEDMYEVVIAQSPILDEIFAKITIVVREVAAVQEEIQQVLGMMDCLSHNARPPTTTFHAPESGLSDTPLSSI